MTAKERELDTITKIPDEYTLDDIGYERYVIESIQQGLNELDRGDDFTHEQTQEKLKNKVISTTSRRV